MERDPHPCNLLGLAALMGELGISVPPLWATHLILDRITPFPVNTPNCSHPTRGQKIPCDPLGNLKSSPSHLAPGGGNPSLPGSVPAPWPMLPFLLLSTPGSLFIYIGITNQEVNSWNYFPTTRCHMHPEASVAILR